VPYLRALAVRGELDFGNLAALAHKMEILDPAIRVAGRQTLRLAAKGPLDPARPQGLVADGRAELIGIAVETPDLPPLRLRGVATITNESIRQQLSVNLGNSDVAVNAVVKNYLALVLPDTSAGRRAPRTHVGVDVRSELIDLDQLMG